MLFCYELREEEREELDTSTESKETEAKEQDVDAVTDEDEDMGPNKKRGGESVFNLPSVPSRGLQVFVFKGWQL